MPPADWDSPVPVPFLSAGGTYLLAVTGPEEWAAAAMKILEGALLEDGVGAKTGSGYGRLKVAPAPETERRDRVGAEAPPPGPWEKLAALVDKGNAAQRVPAALQQLAGEERGRFAARVLKDLTEKWVTARPDGQAWARDLLAAANGRDSAS